MSGRPTLLGRNYHVLYECPQCGSCAVAIDMLAKVGFGPEADLERIALTIPDFEQVK